MAPSKQYDEGGQVQLMEADGRIEEEEECFESIDKLISQGINAGDVKKLQDAGIYTCNGLMMHTKKSLTGIKGLSEAKVDKICEAAEKLLTQGFMTGSDLLIKRKSVVRITTGSQALDELLGGGIETQCITETFGEFRSGKTQLAHTLCVSTQLPLHMHGGNGKVAYIDTEGTFRPERIVPIAERFGMDANAVLDNIIYARAYTYEHQYNLLLGLAAKMAEEPFRLLIVDSVIALFRVDFISGKAGELAQRQRKLAQMLSRLEAIAEEFNVAVYITNQDNPGGCVLTTDPKKPAGGHVLAHTATIRLMLRKGKDEQHVCKIFDAPNLPEGEAVFQITKGGLIDVNCSSKGPTDKPSSSLPWLWRSCRIPRTTSFREDDRRWPCSTITAVTSRNASADGSCFGDYVDGEGDKTISEEWLEALIHSLSRTNRFSFDMCSGSNFIVAGMAPSEQSSLMEGCMANVVDSEDPYGDFRASMQRMVAAHGVCGREDLEELLVWYLRLNERHNHALIIRAFFDILVALPTCNIEIP